MAYRRCDDCGSVYDLNSDHRWMGFEHRETCSGLRALFAFITRWWA
jgi:hypothetical protein